jgi:hypothetical protein
MALGHSEGCQKNGNSQHNPLKPLTKTYPWVMGWDGLAAGERGLFSLAKMAKSL